MTARWCRIATVGSVVALVAIASCANKGSVRTSASAADSAMEAPAEVDGYDDEADLAPTGAQGMDELAQLEVELGQSEAVLESSGVQLDSELARPDRAFSAAGEELPLSSKSTCDRICDIAKAVCELETRICELGERHPGQPRYQAVCRRAHSDCERATAACNQCSGD